MADSRTSPLDKAQISAIVGNLIVEAAGFDGDVLATNREQALRYYFAESDDPDLIVATGETKRDIPLGRSRLRSMDVANLVDSVQAFLSPMMERASIEFIPTNAQDEQQAQAESDAVTDVIRRNNGYQTISGAMFNALLQRNGWIQVEVVELEEIKRERHTDVDDMQAALLAQPQQPNQTVKITQYEEGQLNLTRTTIQRELVVENVAPEQMLYQANYAGSDVQEIDFIARRKVYTRAELLALGYAREDVERCQEFIATDVAAAVARSADKYDAQHGPQWASQLVEVYDCYVLLDVEGNGHAERYKVCQSGEVVLGYEPFPYVPFATGSAIPIPNRIPGKSLFDTGKNIQDAKTEILRNVVDNQKALTQGRVGAVKGAVELDDLLNGRVNGVVRITRPDAITPLPSNDISGSAIPVLGLLDAERTNRGGSAMDMASSDYQIANTSATAAAGELNNKELYASWYGRNLANTLIKSTFLLVHLTLRHSWPEPIMIKQAGQWQEVSPQSWQPRHHAKVITGLSTSDKAQKAQSLQAIFQVQTQLGQMMPGLTNPSLIHNTLVDFVRMTDTGEPESYFMDPQSPESQQAQQQAVQQAQQQQQEQQQMLQMQAQFQMQLQAMQEETDRMKAQMDNQLGYFKALLENDAQEAKLTLDALKMAEEASEPETESPGTPAAA